MTDLAINVDRPYVATGHVVMFNVTMRWGSRYTVDINWDDGTQFSQYIHMTIGGEHLSYTHTFSTPSLYLTSFVFTNVFGTFRINKTVVVQNPVVKMELEALTPIALTYNLIAVCRLTISFTGASNNVPLATDPFIHYEYGDGVNTSSALTIASNSPRIDTHSYLAYGSFNLTLNISNFVNYMFFERTIDVDKRIENVFLWANPLHIVTGNQTKIQANMTWGSRITLNFDFKDETTQVQYIEHYDQPMESIHTYNSPGIYPITVQAINTLDNITTLINESVIVQNPIIDVHFTCTPVSLLQKSLGYVEQVQCDLWLDNGVAEPTDVYLEVSTMLVSVTISLFHSGDCNSVGFPILLVRNFDSYCKIHNYSYIS